MGGQRRNDQPEGAAGDEGLLPPARRQAGGHDRGEHGLPPRGGRRLPLGGGLPLLPLLEREAGQQPAGVREARWPRPKMLAPSTNSSLGLPAQALEDRQPRD